MPKHLKILWKANLTKFDFYTVIRTDTAPLRLNAAALKVCLMSLSVIVAIVVAAAVCVGFCSSRSGSACTTAAAYIARSRWEKVIGRELNTPECVARLISHISTLFFGYTEIIYRYKHLNIAY